MIVQIDYKLGSLNWRSISVPFTNWAHAINWLDPFATLTPMTWDETKLWLEAKIEDEAAA
jgi:hypothetical protein